MEIVRAIISPVADCLMVPVKEHLGYLISYTKYVREMGTKMMALDCIRIGVEDCVLSNKIDNRHIPKEFSDWLKEVRNIEAEVRRIRGDVNDSFDLKMRYKVGRDAFETIHKIDGLIREKPGANWIGHRIPLGKVDSKKASTSAPSSYYNDFKSRESTFDEALKALEFDHNTHMIALCGMGGVGKTTMMEKLKEAVDEKKMFTFIVKAIIGERMDLKAVQGAVAGYLGVTLTEQHEGVRADRLRKSFENISKEGKHKFLVILDDVWQSVDLKDIGLSPLPNQGVDFKFLLTSRDRSVCAMMGVEANSIFEVRLLEDLEAQSFFRQFAGISDDADLELHKIGEDIVRRCGGLPIAIKTIALTLKYKGKDVWEDVRSRLEHHEHDIVHKIFEMSYNNLKEEEKAIFLLCGLFPDDFDIPVEDLMRYGWGLKLFNKVYSLRYARYRLNACIDQLRHANLLIESDCVGCVKMHDLVLAYVLNFFSKVEHAAIVGHGGTMSERLTEDTSESYKRISLKCEGMSEFPGEFKHPNLLLLRLTHGDRSHKFPEDFYGRMEKLQLIAYETMEYPLLPGSLQCSTNLRALCLNSCSLMDKLSPIGNLNNLEILSFARCSIRKLPSQIGNLKKLRLLDLTGCIDLLIDDGVLEKLDHLEELYMRVADWAAIRFTDTNYNELQKLSSKLFALEVEFFKNKAESKNAFFKNLERFRISMGCYLEENTGKDMYSFENTLMLDTNRDELLESRINELFDKTKVLHLKVNGMNDLKDVCVESLRPSPHRLFYNLRVLNISECADVRYLFTLPVARGLSELEHLTISSCPILEELVHIEDHRGEMIRFQELKFLSLVELPKLVSLCRNADVTELPQLVELKLDSLPNFTSIYLENKPAASSVSSNISTMQSFLNKEIVIPKLEKLEIRRVEKLKEVWPCQFSGSEEVNGMNDLKDVSVELLHHSPRSLFYTLRVLNVSECADLRYLFTLPVARGLSKLEHVTISSCPILEELVHIEDHRGEMIRFQELKFLSLVGLPKLVSLCRNADVTELLQLVELKLDGLPNFTSIYPESKSARSSVSSNVSTVQSFLNEEVVIPKLEKLEIGRMEKLKEIWPCQFSGSEEVNICRLRKIKVEECDGLVNLFPTNPLPWLCYLEFLGVWSCGSIEAIFDMDLECIHEIEQGSSSLRHIELQELGKLREVWRMKGVNSSHPIIHGFQAVTHISIGMCKSFRNLFTPTIANFDLGAVESIRIDGVDRCRESGKKNELVESSTSINTDTPGPQCNVVSNGGTSREEVVFEIGSASNTSKALVAMENNQQLPLLPQLEDLWLSCLGSMSHVWKCNWNKFLFPQQRQQQQQESSFHNLTSITLLECGCIKYLFSPLMAKLLPNLKYVTIQYCKGMEEVVSNRDDEDEEMSTSTSSHTNTAFFPHFDTLSLWGLSCLKRIGGNEGGGRSKVITSDVFQLAQAAVASWSLCQCPRNIYIHECNALSNVVPSHAVGQLQKLEVLHIFACESMVEVFETQGINNDGGTSTNVGEGSGVTGTISSIPRMKNMNLLELSNLKILRVELCDRLGHIFTYSTLESLKQLEELTIENCEAMQVIVKEEDGEDTTTSNVVAFPHLKSLTLVNLPKLQGFFMGMNDFHWPLLDKVEISGCPQMVVFTSGRSRAPKLNYIHTRLGNYSRECGLNFHVTTTTLHENPFPSLDSTSSCHILKGIPWSVSNLIEVDVDLINVIPSNELLQLQKLEKLCLVDCYSPVEVFEATNNGLNESQSAVKFPKLKEIYLCRVSNLKYIWKSNQWTVLEFPSLTRVSIFGCDLLEHVFTCSMVGSLLQLEELHIYGCDNMEIIVKETEDSETRGKVVEFPCLKSLKLESLANLKGFCLGKEDFMWPSLGTLEIKECPKLTIFTNGQSTTPELKVIDTSFGLCYAREDPNSFIKTKKQEGFEF